MEKRRLVPFIPGEFWTVTVLHPGEHQGLPFYVQDVELVPAVGPYRGHPDLREGDLLICLGRTGDESSLLITPSDGYVFLSPRGIVRADRKGTNDVVRIKSPGGGSFGPKVVYPLVCRLHRLDEIGR